MRWSPTQIIRLFLTSAVVLVLIPVAGEFFVKLAEENGWYAQPTERATSAISWIVALQDTQTFWYTLLGLSCLTIGAWTEWLVRKFSSLDSTDVWSPSCVKLSLQPTVSRHLLTEIRVAALFDDEARDVRLTLDYATRGDGEPAFGAWTRITLLSKGYVAKGEWIYRGLFEISGPVGNRTLIVTDSNIVDGTPRSIQYNSVVHCVLRVDFINAGIKRSEIVKFRLNKPLAIDWPDMTGEVKLTFEGMK